MTERVQCAECERIYDSDEHPFCPRCGGVKHSDPIVAARSIASRNDPRRRRVQVAGVIMLSTGSLVLLAGIAMLASAGSVWEFAGSYGETDAVGADLSQTATQLDLAIFQDGAPVQGANVTLSSGDHIFGTGQTGDDGTFTFQDITGLVVTLDVMHDDVEWTMEFMAIPTPGADDQTMDLQLELSDQSVINGPIMDEALVENTTRVLGIGSILLGVTPIIGGIAAMRLRNQQMALFGAVIGAIPWLFLFVASMNVAMLLMMALFVMATVFVRQGRDLFA